MRERIYIGYPYFEDVEEQMNEIATELKRANFRVYTPLGVRDENLIKKANLAGMDSCQAMVAKIPSYTGSWAMGVYWEIFNMVEIRNKPTIIVTDDEVLLSHYLIRMTPKLYSAKTLKDAIDTLNQLFPIDEEKS